MSAFIDPPARLPPWIAPFIWLAERFVGKPLLPARILVRYPKGALGSALLEALIAHRDGSIDERMLKLVRLQVSFAVACPFCVDMNSATLAGVSAQEVAALQAGDECSLPDSISPREKLALAYARAISASPLKFDPALRVALKESFSERELVVLAYTAAQVNYWGRLIQALGVPPAGFCERA
jgi:AhpD family alkylhydroperoxidase